MPAPLVITVDGTPKPKGSLRFLGRGRVIEQVDNSDWRARVTAAATRARHGRNPLTGPVVVTVAFTLPRPKTVRRPLPTVRGMDLDKGARLILDALTEARVYGDDSQVVELHASKVYGQPGAVVTVSEVTTLDGAA